jgi:hypothetical protein
MSEIYVSGSSFMDAYTDKRHLPPFILQWCLPIKPHNDWISGRISGRLYKCVVKVAIRIHALIPAPSIGKRRRHFGLQEACNHIPASEMRASDAGTHPANRLMLVSVPQPGKLCTRASAAPKEY